MTRIEGAFSKGKAFIPFVTAGDPSVDVTEKLIYAMAEAGADLIELGIPFSDPVAEGPVIQQADDRALAGGATTDAIFEMVARARKTCQVPLAFMTYANPVHTYGQERFFENCRRCGVDAVIVPDLPFEEKGEFSETCQKYGVTLISMVTPASQARIRMIAGEAEGFLYCVSSMGVTGVREKITTDVGKMVREAKSVSGIPCAIGFGISTPEQAKEMARHADGVIVGSAIVKLCARYGADCVPYVADYVRSMKRALG